MGNHALQVVNAKRLNILCMKIKRAIRVVQLVQ